MTANPMMDPARFVDGQLAQASPDLLRELLSTFVTTLMSADADAVCGATYGATSPTGSTLATVTATATSTPASAPSTPPVLANIALSALDDHFTAAWVAMGDSSARHRRRGLATYRLVRYADDLVVMVKGTREHVEALREETAAVLAPLGLALASAKTRIVHIDDGFDFLGFRIQRQPKRGSGKPTVYTYPSKASLARVKARIRLMTRGDHHLSLAVLLFRLAPVLRGWANYFRHGVSKATFDHLREFAWRRVVQWLRRKHRPRSWKWLRRRYLPRWWPIDGEVRMFDLSEIKVTRYRFRGAVPSPWQAPGDAA